MRRLMTIDKATGRFSRRRFVFRYGSAVAAALAAFVLCAALQYYFEHRAFTVIYVPVVMFAAFAGGRGPAILATILSLCSSAFFLGSDLYRNSANLIDVAFFAVLGPIIGLMGNRLLQESDDSRYRQAQLQSILENAPEGRMVIPARGPRQPLER